MKFDFSAQFLRVKPPDTNFGDAWESLCFALLDAELNDTSLIRLRPPDKGVDILHRGALRAFQCKSSEQGAFGTMSATESVKSLRRAFAERDALGWEQYAFATNANYTGNAYTAIREVAVKLGLDDTKIEFLGPEHWDKLCIRHTELISDRFDYRVAVPKSRVVQAFENQRYFPKYVSEYSAAVQNSELIVRITNNRTPAILEVPFSPELTVKHLVDVVRDVLGVSLDWTNYQDLGTSAGPSVSLTLDRKKQGFKTRIGDLDLGPDQEMQFWITLVWRDQHRKDAGDLSDRVYSRLLLDRAEFYVADGKSLSYGERRDRTIKRTEEIIETMLWSGVRTLKGRRNRAAPEGTP